MLRSVLTAKNYQKELYHNMPFQNFTLLVFFAWMPTYDMLILIIDSYYCFIYFSIIIDSQSDFDLEHFVCRTI
jgi:hypothetical protein